MYESSYSIRKALCDDCNSWQKAMKRFQDNVKQSMTPKERTQLLDKSIEKYKTDCFFVQCYADEEYALCLQHLLVYVDKLRDAVDKE